MNTEKQIALEMRGITKTFGSVVANRNADLVVYRGEILSLLGENGSGKTTLMNMLCGIYYPDAGHIRIDGHEVSIRSPKDAYALGIGMIHQHFKLVDVFTATENVALALHGRGSYNKKNIAAQIREICEKYGFEVDPDEKVYDMNISRRQTLEIVKALCLGAKLLILDEPTAVLTPQETEKLFSVIRKMRDDGKSIIIITHKLAEVLAISDRVAILRKGESVGTVATADASALSLTEMMVGKKVTLEIERPAVKSGPCRIAISHLSCRNSEGAIALQDISLSVKAGEILGIAGISGCGQKELLEAVAGLQAVEEGSSILFYPPQQDGSEQPPEELVGKTPRAIADMGVSLSFVPEDRLGMGLVGSMGMTENMMLKSYRQGAPFFVHKKDPQSLASNVREDLGVVTPGLTTPVRQLSGGNVQKVLVGREISSAPSVLLTAYAVRGLDINTSYAIYDLLNQQKKAGVAVIYVGEDLDVLCALCDRIAVLCGGRLSGVVNAAEVTKEQIGLLMTGNQKTETEDAHHA